MCDDFKQFKSSFDRICFFKHRLAKLDVDIKFRRDIVRERFKPLIHLETTTFVRGHTFNIRDKFSELLFQQTDECRTFDLFSFNEFKWFDVGEPSFICRFNRVDTDTLFPDNPNPNRLVRQFTHLRNVDTRSNHV